jgi:Mg-chelatase subunit ChlD
VLNGDTKDAVLKNISRIKADGYTVLFDATQTGLELLEGKERPALVVFSDGADSRTDGSGKGSTYSKEDIIDYAGEAAVPIYTIGFGNKVDNSTLKQLANDSGGQYFSAKDDKALAGVFTAINSKFGNSFVMTYNRPKEAANADTPIVSLVIDDSGSMNTDPAEEEGCGYRIDKVKKLFHDFVTKIPDQCLIQLIGFQTAVMGGPIIKQEQVTTTDKASILQGIGEMESYGGTPILEALRIAYEGLRSVPSDNKVIVFLTDAALEVEEEEQELFSELLQEIKDNGISILFVGMGVDGKEAVFADAAAKAGGRYVISEDPAVLNSKLEEVLSLIKERKAASSVPLSISISDKSSSGDILNYMITQWMF